MTAVHPGAIHLDAVGGISGDMFVAALLDARPELRQRVLADAAAVLPEATGRPALTEAMSGALRALRFGLAGAPAPKPGQSPPQLHAKARHAGAAAGNFADLVTRIRATPLAPGTADGAVAILTILAEAEAAIHRVPVADVHFHEIADWDSLLDVTAAASIAAALAGARWTVSPLPRGGGLVATRHGLLPVPAPATASILTGFAWRDDGIAGERVTPTGAAILRHLAAESRPETTLGRLEAVGTGAGTRTLAGTPNILRALVFAAAACPAQDRVSVLSFEIDDMSGEEIAVAADRLRQVAGVLDLSIGQRSGKKGRPVNAFHLLVQPEKTEAAIERCFLETSTIGLRVREERRAVLPREIRRSQHEEVEIGVKTTRRPGSRTTAKAESDDVMGDNLEARRRLKERAERAVLE
jgi:pyridinium-3,5-bisthiocarboxylic acid mononucleotide nickel chelatase